MKDIKELCVQVRQISYDIHVYHPAARASPRSSFLLSLCVLCVLCGLIAEEFCRAPRNNRPANAHLHRVALALK